MWQEDCPEPSWTPSEVERWGQRAVQAIASSAAADCEDVVSCWLKKSSFVVDSQERFWIQEFPERLEDKETIYVEWLKDKAA